MNYLTSHTWLLYLLSLLLAVITYTVIDIPEFKAPFCLTAAAYAAVPDLIAVSGIRFYQKGHMIPAIIISLLCCIAFAAAVLLFLADCRAHDFLPAKAVGICAGVLCILTTLLCCISFAGDPRRIVITSCCLCGMVSTAYITGYLTAFAKGLGGP